MNSLDHNTDAHNQIYKKYNLKHSEIYNSFEQERLRKFIKSLKDLISEDPVHVLDVGAGTGNLALKFLEIGCRVTAADVSDKSLNLLQALSGNNQNLDKAIITDKDLPFPSATFDLTVTYSVLHHIPDYLNTIREMLRVTKKGGFIYIDHEANENRWNPDDVLKKYYVETRQTLKDYLLKVIRTREIFTFGFIKAVFIKTFVNKKYQREGDIHVWKDDHIDWLKIKEICLEAGSEIFIEEDYLSYVQKGGQELYDAYKLRCSDTKLMVIRRK